MRRILFLSLIVVGLGLAALQAWPVRLPPADPRGRPGEPWRQTGHPVLLAVDATILDAKERSVDLEWRNVLHQVFGGCDVRSRQDLASDPQQVLEGRRVLVLGRGTLARQSVSTLQALQPFVESGLTVLLEAPEGEVAASFGVETFGPEARPRLPWPRSPQGFALGSRYRPRPWETLALPHTVISARPLAIAGERARPTLAPAGRPLVWSLPAQKGVWILSMLDLGALVHTLRNGVEGAGAAATVDRVACAQLRTTELPWADAWTQAVLDPDAAVGPWPQWWPARPPSDGWLVLSQQGPVTVAEDKTLTLFETQGAAEGLLGIWPDETDAAALLPRRFVALGPLRPAWRPGGLDAQARSMTPRPVLHRNHLWRWPAPADEGWAWLTGAGFSADSSFGPGPGQAGWTCGTAFPFRPLSAEGRVHAIWEVPVHWQGRAEQIDLERVARWMRHNAAGSHGAVHLAFDGPLPTGLLDALEEVAERHGHTVASLSELLETWESPGSHPLRWDFQGRTLRVEVPPRNADAPPSAFSVPRAWGGTRLLEWDTSWAQPRVRKAMTFGKDVLVVEAPAAGGAASFTYGGE